MEEDSKKEDKKEGENERIRKKTKKRKNKREGEEGKNSSSSSSSSRDSSLEREEDGKKPSLKIDSNLLHTDTMPKITTEELGKREDERKDESEEKIATPESPPIQIETIGVRMERRQQQAFENGQQPQQLPPRPPPFFMFKPAEVEEEEEEDENQPPLFGRLDAIAEEDSDELRSASSSRASTARFHLRPSVSPEIKEEQKKEEDIEDVEENNLPKMPFKFLFERQQSAGGSSQSSVAKVVELDNSEDEEDKEKINPKVPRLDLEGVSLENSEAEEDNEQTARDGITPISDTDTIIINEEEPEGEEKNKKVTFEDEKEKIFETKKALELEDEVKREELSSRDRAGPGPRPGFFPYLEFKSRHFLTFMGFFWAWIFLGLQPRIRPRSINQTPESRNRPRLFKNLDL
uniref:Uncharacterized protein n=1 Tax=Meloidogyne incognita TaxID=6306 RepID=A0A914LVJ0_MELIC